MGLTQAVLNNLAEQALNTVHTSRIEDVTLNYKATDDASAISYTVRKVSVEDFSANEMAVSEILENDQKLRAKLPNMPVTPTRWSTVTRSDASIWRIISVNGGPGHPFWLLQTRKVA